jgi:truncated hemoglobin YjbI
LEFIPFEIDPANQSLVDRVKTAKSFQEFYALINTDPRINKAFDKYLKENHQKIS